MLINLYIDETHHSFKALNINNNRYANHGQNYEKFLYCG